MVVERLVAGDLPEFYTAHERREAVRELRRRGYSYNAIANRLRTHQRKVHRDLRAIGLVGSA